jgi:tetratricopeptide (TPR) repeat protein
MMRRWLLALSLPVLVLAMAFWAIRPSPYGDWLGLAGLYQETPALVIREWANRLRGPRTLLGFLSLFPADDVAIAGALFAAIVIVLVLLWNPALDGQPGSGLSKRLRFRWPRGASLRVRTILVIVAILACELGWEVVAWRAWRIHEICLQQISRLIPLETEYKKRAETIKVELANLEAGRWLFGVQESYTDQAKAAILSHDRDRLMREATYTSALVTYYGQLRRMYESDVEDPPRPIALDPPLNEHPQEREPYIWLAQRKYDRALAAFDELILLYPDYPEAHERRAWMLATCPLSSIRDGKLAIMDATRACELTDWKEPGFVSTLAAAYAEAGDFASATSWEEEALSSSTPRFSWDEERLKLYKAGKPLRERR